MKRWEYLAHTATRCALSVDDLDQLGAKGWELVQVDVKYVCDDATTVAGMPITISAPQWEYVFKREREGDQPA